jgi:transposase
VKINKSAKIRALRAKGLSVHAVAKKVGVNVNYVYTLEWKDKQRGTTKSKKSSKAKAAKKTAPVSLSNLNKALKYLKRHIASVKGK